MIPVRLFELCRALRAKIPPEMDDCRVCNIVTDSRTVNPAAVFFALVGDNHDGHDFAGEAVRAGAPAVVVDRDVNLPNEKVIRVDATGDALLTAGRFIRSKISIPVIGITGSVGKTTTKDMIHHLMSKHLSCFKAPGSYNNSVGVPLTLFGVEASHQCVVVEMGTNAPGEIDALAAAARPGVAIITGAGPTHLEGLGSIENVADEKLCLLRHLTASGPAILNGDQPILRRRAEKFNGQVQWFGTGAGNHWRVENIESEKNGVTGLVNGRFRLRLKTRARHNLLNALSAIAVANHLGIPPAVAANDLADFSPPAMRFEVLRVGAITVINDAYNANPVSCAAALEGLRDFSGAAEDGSPGGRKIFVIGDMLELGREARRYHRELGRKAVEAGVDAVWAVGLYAGVVVEGCRDAGRRNRSFFNGGSYQAFPAVGDLADRIKELCEPGDVLCLKGSRAMHIEQVLDGLLAH